ncbi:hypothetical protein GCM10023238_38320 [Streptomyces heliomycini]
MDAQRRLKNVFAQAAPPPPSESFLARLQGLPAGGDLGDGGLAAGLAEGCRAARRAVRRRLRGLRDQASERFEFAYAPVRGTGPRCRPPRAAGASPSTTSAVMRPTGVLRGLRFAFAAAGAVSLAAIALGGVTAGMPTDTEARGAGKGSNVTRDAHTGTGAAVPESQRRRGMAPLLARWRGQSAPLPPRSPDRGLRSAAARDPGPDTAQRAGHAPLTGGATALSR